MCVTERFTFSISMIYGDDLGNQCDSCPYLEPCHVEWGPQCLLHTEPRSIEILMFVKCWLNLM